MPYTFLIFATLVMAWRDLLLGDMLLYSACVFFLTTTKKTFLTSNHCWSCLDPLWITCYESCPMNEGYDSPTLPAMKSRWRSLHLKMGTALVFGTWISCIGLMDSKSGHSITRKGVKWPNSTYARMSRTMFCRGIAAFKSIQQCRLVSKIKLIITQNKKRSNYCLMIIIPSRVSLLHVFDFPPMSAGHSSKWLRYCKDKEPCNTLPFFSGCSVKTHEHRAKMLTCM